MNPIVIITIVFVFLFVPTTVFGTEGYFENNYGKQVSRPPTVCIFQPDDSRINEQRWKLWYPEMKSAIDTWKSVLQQSGSGNWDITTVEIPLNKLDLLNYSECDITVKFVEKPYYMDNGQLANALGWWDIGTGDIKLVFIASDYCGKEFLPKYHVTVDKYCYLDSIERSKRMASVLQHEFGHALGMGHYISDNPQLIQEWYDNDGFGAPSIMTFQPPNEELKKITQIDVNSVREIYGYSGFGKKTTNSPVFFEPVIEPKHEPNISDTQNIQVKPYQTSSTKITGYIPEKLYSRGIPVEFQVTKPDGTKESFATMVSKHQYFEYPMVFGSSSMSGTYEILVIYKGEFIQKNAINLSKSTTSNNNQNSNLSSVKSPQTEKQFEYKKETLKLQKDTDQKINSLKSGILSAEKSLKSTNYKKSEAKEKIKQAWDAIWWAKKYLDNAEGTQKEGITFFSKSDFKSAYYKYKYSFDSAKKIEPYLFEITKSLNDAKKLEK